MTKTHKPVLEWATLNTVREEDSILDSKRRDESV
jgi:hypothetical protein